MICKAICAFREPFDGGFIEAMYPGAMVDVPAPLVNRLVDCGHIERPGVAMVDEAAVDEPAEAPQPAAEADTVAVEAPRARRKAAAPENAE